MVRMIWGLAFAVLAFAGLSHLDTAAPNAAATQARAGLGLSSDMALRFYLRDPPEVWIRPLPRKRADLRLGQFGQGDVCCPGIPARAQQNIATGELLN